MAINVPQCFAKRALRERVLAAVKNRSILAVKTFIRQRASAAESFRSARPKSEPLDHVSDRLWLSVSERHPLITSGPGDGVGPTVVTDGQGLPHAIAVAVLPRSEGQQAKFDQSVKRSVKSLDREPDGLGHCLAAVEGRAASVGGEREVDFPRLRGRFYYATWLSLPCRSSNSTGLK